MHGPVPQASPPQPQVSNSTTSAGTPSVARSAASLLQPHSEHGVEPIRSGRSAALTGCQGVRPKRERCFLAARAGCGAATNSRHAFLGHFRRFCPIYSCNKPVSPPSPTSRTHVLHVRSLWPCRAPRARDVGVLFAKISSVSRLLHQLLHQFLHQLLLQHLNLPSSLTDFPLQME